MQQGEASDDGVAPPTLLRAVEYVRMSTEHQQYSTENQADKIREYAAHRGIEIVRTYADAGKSGLRIDGRVSLQRLLHDVESGTADFTIILVYDVSRWGRFQDADESAYYEYRCRRAGIQVATSARLALQVRRNGRFNLSPWHAGGKHSKWVAHIDHGVDAGSKEVVGIGHKQGPITRRFQYPY